MIEKIEFGTSGYRGIIGKTFTNAHVVAIASAVADYVKSQTNETPKIIVGYDPRTGNSPSMDTGSYTDALVSTLKNQGINVLFCYHYTPTPAISWAIEHFQTDGGLTLTASHNPPNYNGIKFNPSDGAPASTEIASLIENKANRYLHEPLPAAKKEGIVDTVNIIPDFVESLIETIEHYTSLRLDKCQNLPIVIDPRHGAGIETWKEIETQAKLSQLGFVHDEEDAYFGHMDPNPNNPENLSALRSKIQDCQAVLGVANDPDADRHILLDEKGQLLSPEEVCVIILDYLIAHDCPISTLSTTVASSGLIRSAANYHQLHFDETAVGFKFFTTVLKAARDDQSIALAIESSGGFSASFHTLEKCGFLPALLVMSILAETGQPLSHLVDGIHKKYGQFYFKEQRFTFPEQQKGQIEKALKQMDAETSITLFRHPISELSIKDGAKFIFEDHSWVLIRLSGTEPIARIYSESPSSDAVAESLIQEAETFLTDVLKG